MYSSHSQTNSNNVSCFAYGGTSRKRLTVQTMTRIVTIIYQNVYTHMAND